MSNVIQFYASDGEASLFIGPNKWITVHDRYHDKPSQLRSEAVEVFERLGFTCGRWRKTEWGYECSAKARVPKT